MKVKILRKEFCHHLWILNRKEKFMRIKLKPLQFVTLLILYLNDFFHLIILSLMIFTKDINKIITKLSLN
jgi:hypothetical protein